MTEQQKIQELEAKLAALQSQQRKPVEKPAMYIKFGNKRMLEPVGYDLEAQDTETLEPDHL